jgi:N-acetylneuraminic acid mutarotase
MEDFLMMSEEPNLEPGLEGEMDEEPSLESEIDQTEGNGLVLDLQNAGLVSHIDMEELEQDLSQLENDPTETLMGLSTQKSSMEIEMPSKAFSERIPYPTKGSPTPRSHSCCFCYLNKLYSFGGQYIKDGSSLMVHNDLYEFCFENRKWKSLQMKSTSLKERAKHSAVFRISHNDVVIFGGTTSDFQNMPEILNDTYRYRIRTKGWEKIECKGFVPPVYEHTAVYHEALEWMIVFGGWNISSEKRDSTVYILDMTNNQWRTIWDETKEKVMYMHQSEGTKEVVPTLNLDCPTARSNHSAVIHYNSMFIYGGENDYNSLDDVWQFDLDEVRWIPIETKGRGPGPRHSHAACKYGQSMYIHGGTDDFENWNGDLFQLDLENFVWKRIVIDGIPPSPRLGHSMIITDEYHPENKPVVIIFGGFDFLEEAAELNDTFSIQFSDYEGFIMRYQELCLSDFIQKRKLILQEEKLTKLEQENNSLKTEIQALNENVYNQLQEKLQTKSQE